MSRIVFAIMPVHVTLTVPVLGFVLVNLIVRLVKYVGVILIAPATQTVRATMIALAIHFALVILIASVILFALVNLIEMNKMPKYKLELPLDNINANIAIIVTAPSAQVAKDFLLTNHGTKTVADIIQIFETKGGVLEDNFELECTGELIPKTP